MHKSSRFTLVQLEEYEMGIKGESAALEITADGSPSLSSRDYLYIYDE